MNEYVKSVIKKDVSGLTPPEEDKYRCHLPDEELIKRCGDWVKKLCVTGGQAWGLRVPVDFDNDPDMLFIELINRYKKKL